MVVLYQRQLMYLLAFSRNLPSQELLSHYLGYVAPLLEWLAAHLGHRQPSGAILRSASIFLSDCLC